MLQTPLGRLEIAIDNVSIPYRYFPIPVDKTCPDLDGRYAIVIPFSPDQSHHTISCRIRDYKSAAEDSIESGENLELYSFFQNGVKLSLGMEGEEGCIDNGLDSPYDYDTQYLADGVQYRVLPTTKTEEFVFGVAWLSRVTGENDVQTWFGADPSLTGFKNSLAHLCF